MKKSANDEIVNSIHSLDLIEFAYKEYHPSVLSYITYKINNGEKAEDLAQYVFVSLIEYKKMLLT